MRKIKKTQNNQKKKKRTAITGKYKAAGKFKAPRKVSTIAANNNFKFIKLKSTRTGASNNNNNNNSNNSNNNDNNNNTIEGGLIEDRDNTFEGSLIDDDINIEEIEDLFMSMENYNDANVMNNDNDCDNSNENDYINNNNNNNNHNDSDNPNENDDEKAEMLPENTSKGVINNVKIDKLEVDDESYNNDGTENQVLV